MKEKQPDPVSGEPRVFCAKHTRMFRDLQDDPEMESQMTNLLSGDDDDGEVLEITNPEEDTFSQFNCKDDDDVMELAGPGPGIDIKQMMDNDLVE